jgi:hypothetical protein
MKTESKYAIRCLVTGVIVLTMFVVLMAWFRSLCAATQSDWSDAGRVGNPIRISPLPIVPKELEPEPNDGQPSSLQVTFPGQRIQELKTIGLFARLTPEALNPDVYAWSPPKQGKAGWIQFYFDRKPGLVVYGREAAAFDPEVAPGVTEEWYAGPDGVGKTPDKSLGRFEAPIISRMTWAWNTCVYDAKLRRFFRVDWRKRQVTKGPQLGPEDTHHPVALGVLNKSSDCVRMSWSAPMLEVARDTNGTPKLEPVAGISPWGGEDSLVAVLDASGRIEMLDPSTLKMTVSAGTLPHMSGTFNSAERSPIDGAFAYQVMPVWLWKNGRQNPNAAQYLGCVVAAINRDATQASVQVFDSNGNGVDNRSTPIVHHRPGFEVTKYSLENLHPPALLMLSEVAAPYIEAVSGGRDLFVLANSYVADRGRVQGEIWSVRLAAGLGLIAPSLIIAAILAWLVGWDARLFGLPRNTRTLWMLATVVFGIPACITYVLMRPGAVRVTCRNCGKLRRPDQERCHWCDSPWEVPELNAPAWRVFDGAASTVREGNVKPQLEGEQKPDSSVNIM